MISIPENSYLSLILNSGDSWELLGDFDALMSAADQRIQSALGESDAAETARLMHELSRDHYHLLLVGLYKVKEIARAIDGAFQSQNNTVLFSLARSLVEHTAALAYQVGALEKAVIDIPKKPEMKSIRESVARHHRAVMRIFYNQKADIHVHDMIKALSLSYQTARLDYDELCEFVHPNYGSNRIVSGGQLGSGMIGPQTSELAEDLTKAHRIIEHCAKLAEQEYKIAATTNLMKIGSWIGIACQDGSKLTQLFSLRRAFTGDGRTKESSLYFLKARTHFEAREAFHKYLESEKIALLEQRLATIENGFLYDVAITDKGNIWIKYKVQKLT